MGNEGEGCGGIKVGSVERNEDEYIHESGLVDSTGMTCEKAEKTAKNVIFLSLIYSMRRLGICGKNDNESGMYWLLTMLIERIGKTATIIMVLLYIAVAFSTAIIIINNPAEDPNFIRELSNACITVSSVFLASILAIFTIITTTKHTLAKRISFLPLLPIVGILSGLYAMYFSFDPNTISQARTFLAFSMEFTVGSFVVTYLLLDWGKLFKVEEKKTNSDGSPKKSINLFVGIFNPINPTVQFIVWFIIIMVVNLVYFLIIRNLFVVYSFPDAIFNLIILVWVTLVFVYYTYQKMNELRFREALSDLVNEMIDNTERLLKESIDGQIKNISLKYTNKSWVGFDKWPSFTNWVMDETNFYLKYLPTSRYYYFVNQGFFNSKYAYKLNDGIKQIVAKIYLAYFLISRDIQVYENRELGWCKRWTRPLPEDYRDQYYSIIDNGKKLYETQDFIKESIDVLNKIITDYPEIKRNGEYYNLIEKLNK